MADILWISMLEPVGKKTINTTTGVLEQFLCPTDEKPLCISSPRKTATDQQ